MKKSTDFMVARAVALTGAVALIVLLSIVSAPGNTGTDPELWTESSDYQSRWVLGIQSWDSTGSSSIYYTSDIARTKSTIPPNEKEQEDYVRSDYFGGFSRAGPAHENLFRYGDLFVNTYLFFKEEWKEKKEEGKNELVEDTGDFQKFERIFNNLGSHGFEGTKVTSTMHIPKRIAKDSYFEADGDGIDWAKDQFDFPLIPRYGYEDKDFEDWSSEIPYPGVGKWGKTFTEGALYRRKSLPFYRHYLARLSTKYGPLIGYYEPAEEPGWGFNLVPTIYDVDDTYERVIRDEYPDDKKFAYKDCLDKKNDFRTPMHFIGWPTIDYPVLQQVAYDEIKKNDPRGKSCVISGSLVDPESYQNEEYHYWDLYNRAFDDNGRPGQEVSVRIESDKNVFCERPMYFNYNETSPGGHCTFGAKAHAKTWYFAEGTCRPGYDTYFCVQNPGEADAEIKVTYMPASGLNVIRSYTVPAKSRETVVPQEALGKENDAAHDFSTKVECTNGQQIVVERPMYFDRGGQCRGGHVALGVNSPQSEWYFAEGCTRPGFDEYLCIQNPSDAAITVSATYMLGEGQGDPVKLDYIIGPHQRRTVSVNDEVGPNKDVSVKLYAGGATFIAERPMYFNYTGRGNVSNCNGGHNVMGANSASTQWYFAEGCTHPGFEEWICIQNPGDEAADIYVTYMFDDGTSQLKNINVGPKSRDTVFVNDDVAPNMNVSVKVTSSVPVICERPMYFNYNQTLRALKHKGTEEDYWKVDDNGCLSNDFSRATELPLKKYVAQQVYDLLLHGKDGGDPVLPPGAPPPPCLETVMVDEITTEDLRENYNWEFCDRAISGGHNVMGDITNGDTEWYFAEGAVGTMWTDIKRKNYCIGNAYEEYITVLNPHSTPATVRIYLQTKEGQEIRGPGRRWESEYFSYKIPATSRETIKVNTALSFASSCDAIGVHLFMDPDRCDDENTATLIDEEKGLYDPPKEYWAKTSDGVDFTDDPVAEGEVVGKHWANAYNSLNGVISEFVTKGYEAYIGKELVVSSCGWPHGDPIEGSSAYLETVSNGGTDHSTVGQWRMIRAVKHLLESGCRKVWVYKDVDEREAWDNYFGLFGYEHAQPISILYEDPVSKEVTDYGYLWTKYKEVLDRVPVIDKKLPADYFTIREYYGPEEGEEGEE